MTAPQQGPNRAPLLAPGTMVTPNVRLIHPIAEGGMGSVWVADHLGLESRVAVKFISPYIVQRDPSMRERFKREAALCARLRSIHVVQVFDNGVMDNGMPYIVMELLEGQSLTDRVERGGPLPLRLVSMLITQIAKVLERAHKLGIVHRDVKPDNIFLADADYELFVKVLDFGIAKQIGQTGSSGSVTKTGIVVGTPEFMSPEQAVSSKDIDHRSDLYSLAVVTYYAMTGELPYDMESEEPIWMQMASGHFAPPRRYVDGLPEGIDNWFKKALHPKPHGRFQSAKLMARVLAEIADPDSEMADELSTSLGPESSRKIAEALESISDSGERSPPSKDDSLYPAKYDLFGPESGRSSTGMTLVMEESDHRYAEAKGSDPHAAAAAMGAPVAAPPAAALALPPARAVQPSLSEGQRDIGETFPGTNLPVSGHLPPLDESRRLMWAIVAVCAVVVIAAVTTWALT